MRVETGKGVSRSPSPTEKHNEAMITIKMTAGSRVLNVREKFFMSEYFIPECGAAFHVAILLVVIQNTKHLHRT
jgi:hypothetical protein